MIAFEVTETGLVERIINRVKVLTFAESLGGVETLITYPVKQTHGDIPVEIREQNRVTDQLLRISVGIEGRPIFLSYPVRMSHAGFPIKERERLGITPNLIRLSVGLEEPEDLIEDLNAIVQ